MCAGPRPIRSSCGAIRLQVLMQRSAVRLGPLDVFYMVGPPMGIALAPFAYAVELRGHGFSSEFSNAELFGCVVLQAIIALGMQVCTLSDIFASGGVAIVCCRRPLSCSAHTPINWSGLWHCSSRSSC
eukprot:SAG11_NODE_655_length_7909_cov_7.307298_4_plen_128_part_00